MEAAIAGAAFWIAVAAVIVAVFWFRSRREAEQHETLRRIVEKTGQVDEAQLKALFQPAPLPAWATQQCPPRPGSGWRVLRVFGTLVLFVAAGLVLFFAILTASGAAPQNAAYIGFAVGSLVATIGLGLLFVSRFLPRPPPERPDDHKAP